jgi:HK97 family phage major capsid protein
MPAPIAGDIFCERVSSMRRTLNREQRKQLLDGATALRSWIIGKGSSGLANYGFGFAGDGLALPCQRDLQPSGRQSRAQSVALETGGGYAVAEEFSGAIDLQLKYFASVRQNATVVTTERGGPFIYPICEDFNNEGVILAENQNVTELDVDKFGQVKLFPQKVSSKFVLISNELLEDSPVALVDFLARVLGERCGSGANTLYTNTLLPEAPVAVTTAGATAITGDEVLATYYAVDPAYRDSETAGWVMHSSMVKYVRELKDSGGRYLFRKSKKPGSPDSLLGKPIFPNYNLSTSPTAATVSALFGDLSKVLIRDVGGVRIMRAVERWADYDQVGVSAYLRTSCAILDAGGKPIQALVQHS